MRGTFREWYPLSPEELSRLWNEAMIVLDSNVLLELYLYPPIVVDEFFKVLEQVKARLWIPHHVGLEYHRARESKIPEQRRVLDRLLAEIKKLEDNVDHLAWPEHHPVLERHESVAPLREVTDALMQLSDHVIAARDKTPDWETNRLEKDTIRDRVTDLFEGRVGPAFTQEQMDQVVSEGKRRYAAQIPPGFKDSDKDEPQRYYDLVIWKQMLLGAKPRDGVPARATIFVTNDRKEDWWRRDRGTILGPRTELIREYIDAVGEHFHMATPEHLLDEAQTYLQLAVPAEVIADVERISRTSPVEMLLRSQRMIMPSFGARVAALGRLFEVIKSGSVAVVENLNTAIEGLGTQFADSYVSVPLFWSLVNETYGPVRVEPDPTKRLRERRVREVSSLSSRDEFVAAAHVAWLAQALYRIRLENFDDDDVLKGLFGDEPPPGAASLLKRALDLAVADAASRGLDSV